MKPQKLTRDGNGKIVDIGNLSTTNFQNISADTVFNADYDVAVRITTETSCWLKIGPGAQTPLANEGALLLAGQQISLVIEAGHHVASTETINIVPWARD